MPPSVDKFLYRPVTPFTVTQHFGENKACVVIATGKVVECADGAHPPPGMRALYDMRGHLGLDIPASYGLPVYAACSGKVDFIDTNPKSGLDVRIVSEYKGQIYKHIYEHLMGHNVKVGQNVELGDCIGWADNTGYSSGNHLHFQLELWKDGKWVPIDPLPMMSERSALDAAGVIRYIREQIAIISEWIADLARKNR